jgi:hypothetical protein
MQPGVIRKLEQIVERHEEVSALLSDADTISDQDRYRRLSVEYAQLTPIVETFTAWQQALADVDSAAEMLRDPDPEMQQMAAEESAGARKRSARLELDLQKLLLPKDPHDNSNIFLEIRAGTGGDEAALFAGDLFRMYVRYAEQRRWEVEILSESPGEHGGYKEIIARIVGQGAYSRLKFESGAHRPHPYLGRDRRDSTRGRRDRSGRYQPGRPEGRHLPRLRRRRPARQQDRFRHPPDPSPHRHCRRMPGRALPAQEPCPRHVPAGCQAAEHAAGKAKGGGK